MWPELPSDKKQSVEPVEEQSEDQGEVFDVDKYETAVEGYEPERAFRRDLLRFISPIQTAGELPTFICLVILYILVLYISRFLRAISAILKVPRCIFFCA